MNKIIIILLTVLTLTVNAQLRIPAPPAPPFPLVRTIPPRVPIVCSVYLGHNVLMANNVTQSTVDLCWQNKSNSIVETAIEVSIDGINFQKLKVLPPFELYKKSRGKYSVKGLQVNTTYFFRICESLPNGIIHGYQILDIKTLDYPPAAPLNLGFTIIEPQSVVLFWIDNSNNENGFIVERAKDIPNNYETIIVTAPDATTISDYGLHPNTFYYYRVKAFNNGGESGYSKFKLATLPDFGVEPAKIPFVKRVIEKLF